MLNEQRQFEAGETNEVNKNVLIEENLGKLQDYFADQGEYRGIPITKENVEDLFDSWLEDIELSELIKITN